MHQVIQNSQFILDGQWTPNDPSYLPSFDTSNFLYEVIRVIDETPLFYQEHMDRLRQSFVLANVKPLYHFSQLERWFMEFIHTLGIQNGNVKLVQSRQPEAHVLIYEIAHHYPTTTERTGVAVRPFSYVRENPHAKIFRSDFRQEVSEIQMKEGLFEVLLLDNHQCITEGSRSNVFFVKNGKLYTPPSQDALEGITKKMILQAADNMQIPVIESPILLSYLDDFEGAFLSGTSIDVLPISRIGNIQYPSNREPIIIKLSQAYEALKLKNLHDWRTTH